MEDKVLETVLNNLKYNFLKDVLVKPLPATMVEKEVTEQVPTGEKDEHGFELYDTKTEVKQVESEWATGIVLSLPPTTENTINLGDTVIYNKKFAKDFDLFKDSQLVKLYDIVAKQK